MGAVARPFSVVLAGSIKQRFTVRGRNLEGGYDFLSFHRMPWIRSADHDTAEDGDPIITNIEIEAIDEPQAAARPLTEPTSTMAPRKERGRHALLRELSHA